MGNKIPTHPSNISSVSTRLTQIKAFAIYGTRTLHYIYPLFAISQHKEFHEAPWTTVMLINKTRVISFDDFEFKIIVFSSLLGRTKLPLSINH